MAGNAAELIVQERAALSNIHAMLATLELQQRSLLSSLHAKEVGCCHDPCFPSCLSSSLQVCTLNGRAGHLSNVYVAFRPDISQLESWVEREVCSIERETRPDSVVGKCRILYQEQGSPNMQEYINLMPQRLACPT